MGAWLDLLATRADPPLWLDDTAYSSHLLAGGQIPWLDVTALIGWRLKAFALLKPSLAVLDAGALVAAFAAARLGRSTVPGAQRQAIGPLVELLSTAELRQHVADVLHALRQSFRVPLALVMPSPRAWPALTYMNMFGERPQIGADETDEASVIMASFLRSFADSRIDALLLNDDAVSQPTTAEEVEWYQSVINVGRHYRWDVGLRVPSVPAGEGAFDFLIARTDARGVDVGDAFFDTDGPTPSVAQGGFLYARIPAQAAPERVLARLAEMGRR
jgi:hypothetical protein